MSRTYRRKTGDQTSKHWATSKCKIVPGYRYWEWVPLDPNTIEYKRELAHYYSDNYKGFKEPGPSWFRNLHTERPQRRAAKRQLSEYMKNPSYEVILNAKDPLEYYT